MQNDFHDTGIELNFEIPIRSTICEKRAKDNKKDVV